MFYRVVYQSQKDTDVVEESFEILVIAIKSFATDKGP